MFRWLTYSLPALCVALAAAPSFVRAESWCAYPLWVHEWGVQVFATDGRREPPVALPAYFHRSAPSTPSATPPVRHLPPDSGARALPIVQLYSGGSLSNPIPVAIEVGFTEGEATHWYPQVDRRTPAAIANAAPARAARARLLAARAGRGVRQPRGPLDADPTRQLEWSRLDLTDAPAHARASAGTPWVSALRAIDRALWVNTGSESERFVFYEAATRERVALGIEVGAQYAAGRRHYVLHNRGAHPVHDVFVIHREASGLFVFSAPSIPAGASAGFVLDDHRVEPSRARAATRELLARQLVDASEPAPPAEYRWDMSQCVMQRDPAVPVESSDGHRLYAAEVEVILDVWSARFFEQQGSTIVYREDTAYLDRVMPLSIYTDMYNFPVLRRTGLAVWSGVSLPSP